MKFRCDICFGENNSFSWTDTHGVAQHVPCGAIYRIIHYDGDKPIDRDPVCVFNEETIANLRKCRAETGAIISARYFGFSCATGYDIASSEDIEVQDKWWRKNE